FLLRASYGTGFRAPSLTDLNAPVITGTSAPGLNDPLRCPTTGSSLDCNTQFIVKSGGQPSLKPERSESYTAGFVLEPTRNVHFGADFFKINLSSTIVVGGLAADIILDSANSALQFADKITRRGTDPSIPGGYGPIVSIDQTNANLFDVRTSGIDVDFKWRFAENHTGQWTFALNGTYYTKYDVQFPDGSYFTALANNTRGAVNGVIPRWKSVNTLSWDRGPYAASLIYNFQAAYLDHASRVSGAQRTVGTYETFDAQASYSGIKDWRLTLGVRNLLNRDPPYANADTQGQFQSGYDATYGDPRGRFMYASATWKFK
ncbi:MAG: TonB-dependent receptor domain-containing protein, partial [Burkholderiaceae bacterium]